MNDLQDIYNNLNERRDVLTKRITDLHKASNVVEHLNPNDLLDAYRIINENNNNENCNKYEYANDVIHSWYQYHAYLELGIINTQICNVATILKIKN